MIFSSITHIGLIKKENQDYIGHIKTEKGDLFVVCDGLSGLNDGALASKTAVTSILEAYSIPFNHPGQYLKSALEIAHADVMTINYKHIGTTVVAVYIENDKVYVAWCGDSRIYHFNNHIIQWMSKDHIVLHDLLNHGILVKNDFRNPNAITRYLGRKDNHQIDYYEFSITMGSRILICSDGLTNYIMEPEIINTISDHNPKEASNMLKSSLLSASVGAPDNFSWYIIKL